MARRRLTRTFVDSGVLIVAAKGSERASLAALSILDDPTREVVTSDLVRLEVLPYARNFRKDNEVAFFEAFFASVRRLPVRPDLNRVFSSVLGYSSHLGRAMQKA